MDWILLSLDLGVTSEIQTQKIEHDFGREQDENSLYIKIYIKAGGCNGEERERG
jgi:hypothetical protein